MLNIREIINATNGKLLNGNEEELIQDYKIDSREVNKGDFYIPLIGEKVDGHKFILDTVKKGCSGFFVSNFDFIDIEQIISMNNNIAIIQVDNTKEALINLGIYNRNKQNNIEVVAITGSVGKTSTREMVASVLSETKNIMVTQKNMNSHIGMPLMDLKLENQEMADRKSVV